MSNLRWTIKDAEAPPRWRVGPRVWRVDGEWRLRLYRPWRPERLIEVRSVDLRAALLVLGAGAGWWTT